MGLLTAKLLWSNQKGEMTETEKMACCGQAPYSAGLHSIAINKINNKWQKHIHVELCVYCHVKIPLQLRHNINKAW